MALGAKEIADRGRELASLREQAYQALGQNPDLTPQELSERLGVNESTARTWRDRWRRQSQRKEPVISKEPLVTFEQILEAVPDTETLAILTFQGMMKLIEDKDDNLKALKQDNLNYLQALSAVKAELEKVTEEKNRIMREYNELLSRKKVETLDLTQVKHRLALKQ